MLDVLQRAGLPDVSFEEGTARAGPWPAGIVHLYRESISTRSIEVGYEDGLFDVRLLVLTCPEDYVLALRLIGALAESSGVAGSEAAIEPEDNEPLPLTEWQLQYGDAWIAQQVQSDIDVTLIMTTQRGETLGVVGPHRTADLTPALVADLQATGPPETLPDRLYAALRRMQYLDAAPHGSSLVPRQP